MIMIIPATGLRAIHALAGARENKIIMTAGGARIIDVIKMGKMGISTIRTSVAPIVTFLRAYSHSNASADNAYSHTFEMLHLLLKPTYARKNCLQ